MIKKNVVSSRCEDTKSDLNLQSLKYMTCSSLDVPVIISLKMTNNITPVLYDSIVHTPMTGLFAFQFVIKYYILDDTQSTLENKGERSLPLSSRYRVNVGFDILIIHIIKLT